MDPKVLNLDKIEKFLQPEFLHLTLGTAILSWLIYKIFLRQANAERHRNLQNLFGNLWMHLLLGGAAFGTYSLFRNLAFSGRAYERPALYLGLISFVWGLLIIVKASRILLFEYLFISHMRVPVPLLLVNLFTLILSFGLSIYVATEVFDVKLTPLLATSAIFSLVVGLALQDTLGNLFAGVSLQFDKPYSIDDWVEISTGTQKWVGCVKEISWRATLLQSFTEEAITIPNRVMTQSQIANFNTRNGPILRNQSFRMPYDVNIEEVKNIMSNAVMEVEGIRKNPKPYVLITEVADSWLLFKLLYYIDDYGVQFTIGDRIVTEVTHEFQKRKIRCAVPKIDVKMGQQSA